MSFVEVSVPMCVSRLIGALSLHLEFLRTSRFSSDWILIWSSFGSDWFPFCSGLSQIRLRLGSYAIQIHTDAIHTWLARFRFGAKLVGMGHAHASTPKELYALGRVVNESW